MIVNNNEEDLNTVNNGTISSYSISSKSKNAMSINIKNSLYKKIPEDNDKNPHKESTFDDMS